MKFFIIRYKAAPRKLTASPLVKPCDDAFVLSDVCYCGAHALKKIFAEEDDDAPGLGGVDKVVAMFYEMVVECCDVVIGPEFAIEVGEYVFGDFDLWEVSVIDGGLVEKYGNGLATISTSEKGALDAIIFEFGFLFEVVLGRSWLYIPKSAWKESSKRHWDRIGELVFNDVSNHLSRLISEWSSMERASAVST